MGDKLKSLILALILSMHLWAQGSNTIFKQVLSNVSTAQASSNVTNIGQSQHIVYIILSNAPAQTCTGPTTPDGTLLVKIEGSYNNSTFFSLTAANLQVTTNNQGTLYATGLAPYVRVHLVTFSLGTTCRLNAFYAGSLYPVYVDKLENTRLANGYTVNQLYVSTAVATTISATNTTDVLAIYGLVCGNGGTAQAVTFDDGTSHVRTITFSINGTFVLPTSQVPIWIVPPVSSTAATLTVTTAQAEAFWCFVSYRQE